MDFGALLRTVFGLDVMKRELFTRDLTARAESAEQHHKGGREVSLIASSMTINKSHIGPDNLLLKCCPGCKAIRCLGLSWINDQK